jgi:hypothetical protein
MYHLLVFYDYYATSASSSSTARHTLTSTATAIKSTSASSYVESSSKTPATKK